MNGMHNLELARVLSNAHRHELAATLHAPPGPAGTVRSAVGQRLVRIGTRMLGSSAEPHRPATPAVGC
jgi:hypothetical protein